MKPKMGRPKQPKSRSKAILIGARFSPIESKQVHAAAMRSKKEKSQWIRSTLLAAANPEMFYHMKIKLTVGEVNELAKQPLSTAHQGGFQNFLVQLQRRVDGGTGELEL